MTSRLSISFAAVFALGLVCLVQPAIATTASNTEYSLTAEKGPGQPAATANPYEKAGSRNINGRSQNSIRIAQSDGGSGRKNSEREKDSSFDPPLPTRRKSAPAVPATSDNSNTAPQASGHTVAPEIDQALGQVLLFYFKGTQPSDSGPKAIRALLQSGHIAGAVFTQENVVSKAQLKEIMKFLWQGNANSRPIFATGELGGDLDAFPVVKDFERWPSQQTVATKGDAQYAYSTYQSLASNLATLGFNLNFGPSLVSEPKGQPSNTFGSNPLQAGVFAKTFVLGHRDSSVLPVPIVDESELSIRALKTLLVSYPDTPVAFTPVKQEPMQFVQNSGIVRGAHFCFIALDGKQEEEGVAQYFGQGCDILVLNAGTDSPAAARERVAQAVSDAIAKGELSLNELTQAAQRLSALRSSLALHGDEHPTKSAHAH